MKYLFVDKRSPRVTDISLIAKANHACLRWSEGHLGGGNKEDDITTCSNI